MEHLFPGAPWLAPAVQLGMAVATGLLLGAVARLSARKPIDAPWPDSAKLAWERRRAASNATLLAGAFAAAHGLLLGGPLNALPGWGQALLGFVAATFAAGWVLRPVFDGLDPFSETRRARRRGAWAYQIAARGHSLVLLASLVLWPLGVKGLLISAGLTLATTVLLTLGKGLDPLKPLGLAWPAEGPLAERARVLAEAQEAPLRALWVLDWGSVNAMAFPAGGRVAVTRGALERLSPDALDAILSHEFGHLREGPGQRALILLGALGVALLPLSLAAGFGIGPVAGGATLLSGFAGLRWVQKRRRALEHEADAHAHEHDDAYLHALVELHRLNNLPAVVKTRTHPSLVHRLEAGGLEPDFEVPAPPRTPWLVRGVAFGVALTMVVAFTVATMGLQMADVPLGHSLRGGDASSYLVALNLDPDALAGEDPQDPEVQLAVAVWSARRGLCEDAQERLDFAAGQTSWTDLSAQDLANEVTWTCGLPRTSMLFGETR